jgi:hypothetical protein
MFQFESFPPPPPRLVRWLSCGALWILPLSAQPPPAVPAAPPMRAWTSVSGNVVDGAFVKEEDGKIYLQRPDGSMIATTRAKLSPNDLLWIDRRSNPEQTAKTESFTKATQLETTKMEGYKKIRRIILKTYAQLTNNDRNDKMLAFLERDALSMYGWQYIGSDCYLTKSGKKGILKELQFMPQAPVPLREAVQMTRDKFTLVMPDPVIAKEITFDGDICWEIQNPPDYVARALLLVDPETKNIKRFDFHFPPPDKP